MYTPSRSLVLHSWYSYTSVVLIIAILAWAFGLPGILLRAQAAQLSQFSDTLTNSKPGVVSNHTIQFTTPSGVPADGSTIDVVLPDGFDASAITEDDIDIAVDSVDRTTDTVCGAVEAAVTISGQHITIEVCSGGGGAIDATSEVVIEIGTNATASGVGVEQVVNHVNTGSYRLSIGGTMEDIGATNIVIIDSVRISGNVETYLDFTITGVDANETVNTDTTFATTTATSVPFSTVNPNTEYVLAQDLSVTTNAGNGFTVRVFANTDLISTTGATIDSFANGTDIAVPQAWSGPSAQSGLTDTYGHWGLTTEDASLSDNDSFGDALYVGNFIGNPREVMFATTSSDGVADHLGATRVGYKLEVSTLQEAASDYSTQLTYIVTPTF